MRTCLVFFVLFLSFVYSQVLPTCVDPCTFPLQYCNFVDYPVPSIVNATFSDEAAGEQFTNSNFTSLQTVFPACGEAIKLFTCSLAFPSCSNATTPISVVKPCIDTCQKVHTACAGALRYFDNTTMQKINCSAIGNDLQPVFETDETKCQNLTSLTPLPCFNTTKPPPPTYDGNNTNPAGGCIKYNISLTPLTGAMCAPYVSSDIFAPSPDPSYLGFIDGQVGPQAEPFILFYPLIPIKCYKYLSSLLCQTAYPTCEQVNATFQAPKPHCYKFCQDTVAACSDFFALLGGNYSTLLDCDTQQPGLLPYPKNGMCTNDLLPEKAVVPFYLPEVTSCPSIMGRKKNPTEDEANCGYPCPDHTYSPEQIDGLIAVYLTLGSISFALVTIMGVSQALVAEKRTFPTNLQMWMCFIIGAMVTSLLIGGSDPRHTTWCKDAGTYNTQHTNARCAAQAIMFSYFGLVGPSLSLILAFTLFLVIVIRVPLQNVAKQMKYFQIFVWGFPLPFVIAAAVKGKFGFMPMLPLCFIVFEDFSRLAPPVHTGMTIDWPLYFIPNGVLAISTLILFIGTILHIFWVSRSVRDVVSSDPGVAQRAQRRVGIFVLMISIVIVITLEWRFEIEAKGIYNLETKVLNWFTCKLKTELGLPDPGSCESAHSPGVGYVHLMIVIVMTSSLGTMLFLAFGFDKNNYKMWPMIWDTVIYTHQWGELWNAIRYGVKQLPTSTTGSNSKGSRGTPASGGNLSQSPSISSLSNSMRSTGAVDEENISMEVELTNRLHPSSSQEVYLSSP